jgi:ABC-type phosphate/phosphonate transport system substrate-binding protein
MIASLPMYDWPEVRTHTDRYWQAIRAALGTGPIDLTRDASDMHAQWLDPDLLLSQTCGMPYRTRLLGKVTRIGTPDYALPGCPAGHYCSVIVANAQDDRGQLSDFTSDIFAYNEGGSQSGWAAPMSHAAALGLRFDRLLATGAHRASIRAVAEGRAALASIDAMTWELALRHEPAALQLKVLARTDPTPGLPYITALGRDPAPIARAIARAIADLDADTRAALHLSGLCDIPDQAYLAVPTPPAPAA